MDKQGRLCMKSSFIGHFRRHARTHVDRFTPLSRRKQGLRERQLFQVLTALASFGVQRLSNKRLWTAMDIQSRQSAPEPI